MTNRTAARVNRLIDARRKARAQRPVIEKLAIAEELRDLQEALATSRAANKVNKSSEKIANRIKTK